MPASFDLEVKDRRSVWSINTKPSGGRLVAPYPIRIFPLLAAKVKKPAKGQQFRNDIRLRSSLCRRSLWLAEVLDDRANSHSRANLTSVACTGV
jgi:hypothetical protein